MSKGDVKDNYLQAYHKINSKLSKKLFKKANAREALGQFRDLYNEMKRNSDRKHAAFCCMAVARCEQALHNLTMEASWSLEAGALFMAEEFDSHSLGFDEFEEYGSEAIQCYLAAIQIYQNQDCHNLASSLCHELADALRLLDKFEEAAQYYHRAADAIEKESPITAVSFLDEAVQCELQLKDYDGAGETLLSIIQKLQRCKFPFPIKGGASSGGGPGGAGDHATSGINSSANPMGSSMLGPHTTHRTPVFSAVSDYGSFIPHTILTSRVTIILICLVQRLFTKAEASLAELTTSIAESHGGVGNKTQSDLALLDMMESLISACRSDDLRAIDELQLELAPHLSWRCQNLLAEINTNMRAPQYG